MWLLLIFHRNFTGVTWGCCPWVTVCQCVLSWQRVDTNFNWLSLLIAAVILSPLLFFSLALILYTKIRVQANWPVTQLVRGGQQWWSLGLEGLRSRLGLEGFRSRSWALHPEILHRLVFMKFCKEFLKKTVLKNDGSKFSCSKRSVATFSLLLCYLRDGENNLPSTPFKIYTEFNERCACTRQTAADNLCNMSLGVLC